MDMNYTVMNKFNNIFNDFEKEVATSRSLCKLKDFTFYGESLPDYSDKTFQKIYLVRYLLAYYTEYYEIYKKVIEEKFIKNSYNILSIGCGCGVDLWGFKNASNGRFNYKYTGLDCVRWDYSDFFTEKFINAKIENISKLNNKNYNVFMFPKSIGEFSEKTFKALKNTIAKSTFNEKNIVLISAHRKSRFYNDRNRLNEILGIYQKEHGYKLDREEIVGEGYSYDSPSLSTVIPQISYPRDKKMYVKEIFNHCKKSSSCSVDCQEKYSRYPVISTSQFCYQIIYLKK